MKKIVWSAAAALCLVATACGSGDADPSASNSASASYAPTPQAPAETIAPSPETTPETTPADAASTEPDDSNITSAVGTATDFNEAGSAVLDTLKCSQWLRIDGPTREQAAGYYLLGVGDDNFADDAPSTAKLVTTSCKAYGDTETPKHIVAVLWKTYSESGG